MTGVATSVPSAPRLERRAQIILALVVVPAGRGRARPIRGDARHRCGPTSARISGTRNRKRADIGRHRIAGQAEHAHRAEPPVHHRLARPHRDLPERHREAFGRRAPAAPDRGRRPRRRRSVTSTSAPASRARRMPAVVASSVSGGDAEVDDVGAFAARRARAARSRWNRRSGPGRASCPASPARRRSRESRPSGGRCTGTRRMVHAAASARSRSVSRRPLAQQHVALAEVDAGRADVPPGAARLR